jgi:hypothetical protein
MLQAISQPVWLLAMLSFAPLADLTALSLLLGRTAHKSFSEILDHPSLKGNIEMRPAGI